MKELKQYKTCGGCRGSYTTSGDGDWNCLLGFTTNLINHKEGHTIMVPVEPCPKPRTARERNNELTKWDRSQLKKKAVSDE